MTRLKLGSWEPGSDEWHAARSGRLGGSEIAAVLGLSPFDSRFSLFYRKQGEIGPTDETPEMEWGKRLEPVIVAKCAEEHPEWKIGPQPGTFVHALRSWQLANPDALVRSDDGEPTAVVEAKFSLFGDDCGEPGTDEIPVYWRTQGMWYLDVLGLPVCHFAVLVGGHDYREYRLEYDEAEATQLRDAGRAFLDDVQNDIRPDIDEHGATYQAIKELHPQIDGSEVELDADLVAEFIASRLAKAEATAEAARMTSVLAEAMGEAHRATYCGMTIATRQARGDGLPYVVIGRGLIDREKEAAA